MIDFSTVKSWTIPEGTVKQVTDASGRVLWLGVRDRVGTLYMRPSADISFTGDKYPEDLAYGYLAISEKVADEYATYIGKTEESMTSNPTVEGTFSISLDKKNISVKKVISGEIGITYFISLDNSIAKYPEYAGLTVRVTVLGTEYELINISDDGNGVYDGLRKLSIPNGMITNINNYLSANGTLPEMSMYLLAKGYYATDSSTSKKEVIVKIDQAYLALECEYIG